MRGKELEAVSTDNILKILIREGEIGYQLEMGTQSRGHFIIYFWIENATTYIQVERRMPVVGRGWRYRRESRHAGCCVCVSLALVKKYSLGQG